MITQRFINMLNALGWSLHLHLENGRNYSVVAGGYQFGPVAWPNPDEFLVQFVDEAARLAICNFTGRAWSAEDGKLLSTAGELWWADVGARGHQLQPEALGWARCRDFSPNIGRGSSTAISHGLRALFKLGLVERRPLHERLRPVFEYRVAPMFEKPFNIPNPDRFAEVVIDIVVERRKAKS